MSEPDPNVQLDARPLLKSRLEAEPLEVALRTFTSRVNTPSPTGREYWADITMGWETDRVLAFDTETSTRTDQALHFGYCEVRDKGETFAQVIFYGTALTPTQLDTLEDFCQDHSIELMPVKKFVDEIFIPEVYDLKALCVGFNLPFDLSRLAIHWGKSRRKGMGSGYSFQLSTNPLAPRIIVKHNSSTQSFIQFTNRPNFGGGSRSRRRARTEHYRGRFLDLRTLAKALTDKKHTLQSACKRYGLQGKKGIEEHGKVTPEYIEYCIQDVQCTFDLYHAMQVDYTRYNLQTVIDRVYSPATIGKDYLERMGVKAFMEKNPDFEPEILGYVMTTYYGGRCEVRIRKTPVEIAYMDVLSMYPTVNILMGLWQFVICDHVDHEDDTENVRRMLDDTTLETIQDQDVWKQFPVVCLVEPDEDIFPVRAHYGDKHTFNIGLNYLTSQDALWYSYPDVLASKLLTGKTPKILEARRFIPVGVQEGLEPIELIDGIRFDPRTDDLFKVLIETRQAIKDQMKDATGDELKKLESKQHIIKIITNSTSYGIFVEINTKEMGNTDIMVHGLESFEVTRDKAEEPGRMFNPIMGAFITSGARLILAIAECIVMDHGGTYAFCDTDSMAVPVELVEHIQSYFDRLNPYRFDKHIFELEGENFKDDEREPLFFYGISAKRYVLYNLVDGKPVIRKFSAHGLGHLMNPFGSERKWHQRIWQDILDEHYGIRTREEIEREYEGLFAISQMNISSPRLMSRFKAMNQGKPQTEQIKPFNFMLVGVSNQISKETGEHIKPIAPFSRDVSAVPFSMFIDYHSGKQFQGSQYWKSMVEILRSYRSHPEGKFHGNAGILSRRRVSDGKIVYIGKESNRLEEAMILGVGPDGYVVSQVCQLRLKGALDSV